MLKTVIKIEGKGYYTGQYREYSCTPKEASKFNSPIEAEEDITKGNYLEEEIDPNFYNLVIKLETIIVT